MSLNLFGNSNEQQITFHFQRSRAAVVAEFVRRRHFVLAGVLWCHVRELKDLKSVSLHDRVATRQLERLVLVEPGQVRGRLASHTAAERCDLTLIDLTGGKGDGELWWISCLYHFLWHLCKNNIFLFNIQKNITTIW